MTIAIWAIAAYCVVATAVHIGSILIAMRRCRKGVALCRPAEPQTALGLLGLTRFLRRTGRRSGGKGRGRAAMPGVDVAGVSLVRPVCGLENNIEDTLRSALELDYPRYEIIFCAAAADDTAVPLVCRLMDGKPRTRQLGHYPVLKVKEARKRARVFRADPQKALAKADADTFAQVAEDWFRDHVEAKSYARATRSSAASTNTSCRAGATSSSRRSGARTSRNCSTASPTRTVP